MANEVKYSDTHLAILSGLGLGRNVKEIAGELGKSEKTVEFHIGGPHNNRSLYRLTGCNSRAGLVRFACENGLVKPGDNGQPKPLPKSAPKVLRNSNDLVQHLLDAGSKVISGDVDVLRVNALCNVSDALCRVFAVQMKAEERATKLSWLTD